MGGMGYERMRGSEERLRRALEEGKGSVEKMERGKEREREGGGVGVCLLSFENMGNNVGLGGEA